MTGHLWRLPIVLGTLATLLLPGQPQITPTTIWPTNGWQRATPESQGLDSNVLAEMVEFVRDRHLPLHGIVVVRHGRLVLDANFYPYDGSRPHDVASATKSVTSAVIGIAIDKGLIASVGEGVRALLPAAMPAGADARRDAFAPALAKVAHRSLGEGGPALRLASRRLARAAGARQQATFP
jgi:CubicO group peptidase (beta-lactamase class C family)